MSSRWWWRGAVTLWLISMATTMALADEGVGVGSLKFTWGELCAIAAGGFVVGYQKRRLDELERRTKEGRQRKRKP